VTEERSVLSAGKAGGGGEEGEKRSLTRKSRFVRGLEKVTLARRCCATRNCLGQRHGSISRSKSATNTGKAMMQGTVDSVSGDIWRVGVQG
jgi:hypothetical protein